MHKVILDVDSVGDDILAILYGVKSEEIDLLGITVTSGASGDLEHAVRVALKSVEIAGGKTPVYRGQGQPLKPIQETRQGDPVNFYTKYYSKFGDRLQEFNAAPQEIQSQVASLSAVDYIIQTIKDHPGEVSIVVTGPMTNLAQAIQQDPSIIEQVKAAYLLGGVFKVPGNITPVVEYNIYGDPEAAKIVFNSGLNIILVPLDVCEDNSVADSMLTRDDLYDLSQAGEDSEVIEFLNRKFPIYIDVWREFFDFVGFPMDDVITLALVAHPSFCEYSDPVYVDVELGGEATRGQTIAYFGHQIMENTQRNMKNTRIATTIRGKEFMHHFKSIMISSKRD